MKHKFSFLLSAILLVSLFIAPVGRVSALTNLVQDPSLEAAIASTSIWHQNSTNSDTPLCTLSIPECNLGAITAPRTGSVWALFGGIDWTDPEALTPEIGDLYQDVTFPNSCSATLQFYFRIGAAPAGSAAADVFIAKIDGVDVFTANATQKSTYTSYTLVSVNVSSFANGTAHKVEFYSVTNGQTVIFNLDDISLTDTCFKISGNAGVADATLNYTGGSTSANSSGNYSFDVPTGWSGTVTPSKSGYIFSPENIIYSNVDVDQTGQDYTAIPALVVTNADDSGPGSLRQTIANSSAGNAITFDTSLAGQTITLSSELVIDKNLIIDGSALASKINISGNSSVRVFLVNSGVTVVMDSLTIKNGKAIGNGGAISNNGGTLTVTNSIFSDSNATGDGGAIYNGYPGILTINEDVFNNNNASRGGGIMCDGLGTLTILNSTYSSNQASSGFGDGGAIYTTCNSTIANSTFSANTAANSGGAMTADNDVNPVVMMNSTFYGNMAPTGGGIANYGGLIIINNTFSNNNSSNGGALRNGLGGVLSLRNSILANSIGGVDCIKSSGTSVIGNVNNLVETTGTGVESCGAPFLSSDPMLGLLANNIGLTQTMALLPGSPAINAGDDASCPETDQRGVTRPQGSHCDIGAYESETKPGIPILLSPLSGKLLNTLQPTLDWKDSKPAAHHYQVQVSTNNTFTNLVVDNADLLTSDFTLSSNLDSGKRYFWRVRAFNVSGGASGWSEIWSFKTPLAKVTLLFPSNGLTLATDRPDFDWEDVGGAASYILQVSPSMSFDTLLVNTSVIDSEYSVPKDLPQKKLLYWRAQAKTSVVTGPWSEKCTFTTGNPPSVPALVSPVNNALIKDYTPLLNWSNSTVPAGTTFKHYELQVDDNSDFSSPAVNISTTNGILTESNFTPGSDLNANTKYSWRVRAVNTVSGVDHYSGWSKVWTFRAAMLAPTLLTPFDTTTVGSLKPTLTWGIVTGATKYAVQIATSSSFGTLTLVVNTTIAGPIYTPGANLPKNKTLYWRVRALGPNGPSAWSTTFSFHTPQ